MTRPRAANSFIKTDALANVAKPIMDMFRSRKKKEDKYVGYDKSSLLEVKLYAKHIDCFSAMLKDNETLKQMLRSKTSPINPLISVLFHAN